MGGSPDSSAWPCSGWGLPCRVRYRTRGGLLHHPFTLTGSRPAVCFLWHYPRSHLHRALPGILPCGARTFLPILSGSGDRLCISFAAGLTQTPLPVTTLQGRAPVGVKTAFEGHFRCSWSQSRADKRKKAPPKTRSLFPEQEGETVRPRRSYRSRRFRTRSGFRT